MLRSVPQMLKKWRIVVNRISKVRQTACNWIKKILDEATRIVISVFNILILLFMFNELTCKVLFHIAVWSLSNAIKASSFIENFPQISAKPIGFERNLLGKLSRNRPFFTNRFSAKLASKIPAKSAIFSVNLSLKIPRNLTVFSATYQKPWINHGGDKPWYIQSERYPIRGRLAEKQRLAQALVCIWNLCPC